MNKFKSIMLSNHTEEKSKLQKLYVDRFYYDSHASSSEQFIEDEKVFHYQDLRFWFSGTGFRAPERLVLYVGVPERLLDCGYPYLEYAAAYEDYLLCQISDKVNELSEGYQNDKKSSREKPHFAMQETDCVVRRRNGCCYEEDKQSFCLRISFTAPLINGTRINGKSGFKAVRDVLEIIGMCIAQIDKQELRTQISLYKNQMTIRNYLKEHQLIAFVADSSILPRSGDTQLPLEQAVPFCSPPQLRVAVPLPDGTVLEGMGVKKGITVITGGGYSGKSTLLDSLETGIYNHRGGDGREYVITDETACKIYAEDGRFIQNTDISPFFSHMPGDKDIHCFSTPRASGGVSQGTNIIEAVYGGCRLLLIDEDTSATNFMIRDETMRILVEDEPIVPFTDRVTELKHMGISTILVVGGSGEYLKYADTVLLMRDYQTEERTEYAENLMSENSRQKNDLLSVRTYPYCWTKSRYLREGREKKEFFYCESVQIENARYIRLDHRVADITKLTAIRSQGQIASLTFLLERLLMQEGKEDTELMTRCQDMTDRLMDFASDTILSNAHRYELWVEEIRPIDLYFALSRMRGVAVTENLLKISEN